MRTSLLIAAAFCLAACQKTPSTPYSMSNPEIEGIAFIEQVLGKPGETQIPYQKYQLENGLTILLHKDSSDPLVHVDVTYHVGSAREDIGKSGFAHLFEHMMFQGSEHVADEQHFKTVTEAGGNLNGTTNSDRTNYYQTVPANQLEKMLWLEADRMGYLLNAVTQEKFEVQRETVKNERGQRYDNAPYMGRFERIAAALYPSEHPYSWPVIGFMDDLNRVNVNDIKAFFMRWYGPNNATITVGGDIDEAETLRLIKKYFLPIPTGPKVVVDEKATVSFESNRYISMEDNIYLPLLSINYPTTYARHEDEAPLDILSDILGSGKTSILYKNLVKSGLAVQAGSSHPCQELACQFVFYALPHPAKQTTLKTLESLIQASLEEFEQRGVKDMDLRKSKAKFESQFIFGLQSVSGKVRQLAAYETFTGDPDYITRDIARYNAVTKEDVMRVYKQYFKNKGAVVMSVVPKGQADRVAAEDNFVAPARNIAAEQVQTSKIAIRRGADTFDRSIVPGAGANKGVDVPPTWRLELDNGITVLGALSTETPTTSVLLQIPAGHYYSSTDKAGVASLTAQMLNEGTLQRSAEAMSEALDLLGSRVAIYSNDEYISVNVNTLSKHLDATMALVLEKLTQPKFEQADFQRLHQNMIQGAINNKKNANYLARTAFYGLLYQDSIAAIPSGGTEQTLANITLEDVKAHYQGYVKPANAMIINVSDLPQSTLTQALSVLNPWQGKSAPMKARFPMPTLDTGTIYLVDKKDAAQTVVRMGKRSLTFDMSGEYFEAGLMNFTLGGAFNSRINLNLREDKGYTYGAGSGFNADKYAGVYFASAEVRADVTDKSMIELLKEVKTFAEQGITDQELVFMRNSINQRDALKYETPRAKLGFLSLLLEHNASPEFVTQRNQVVATIDKARINQLAKKHLKLDEMIFVVVGDAASLKPKLQALGYPVVDYSL